MKTDQEDRMIDVSRSASVMLQTNGYFVVPTEVEESLTVGSAGAFVWRAGRDDSTSLDMTETDGS